MTSVPNALAPAWSGLLWRGLFSLALGLLALSAPTLTASTLVLVFGAVAFVDGLATLIRAERRLSAWLAGSCGVALGGFALAAPLATAQVLVLLFAAWLVVGGLREIGAALALGDERGDDWFHLASGGLAVLLGLILGLLPALGLEALTVGLGACALLGGAVQVAAAVRLRRRAQRRAEARRSEERRGEAAHEEEPAAEPSLRAG